MKKSILFLFTIALFCQSVSSQDYPYDEMVGFATQNGGTTGGKGGDTVVIKTLEEFKKYASNDNPVVIKVSGHITSGDDKGASVKIGSNKSIIGIGADAFFDGIGFTIKEKKNIIIRNLKFTLTSVTNKTDTTVYDKDGDEGRPQILTNQGDCIRIMASTNLWVDHCEFFQENPKYQANQDLYDGLLDVSGASNYITVSWCYFHDHHKCTLVGNSDKDAPADRMITFHHNYYNNISQRTPSYRGGKGHVFNNYFVGLHSGVNCRAGACVKVEGNVFENCQDPIIAQETGPGFAETNDNWEVMVTKKKPTPVRCVFNPPYDYKKYLQDSGKVKKTVKKYVGVGIIK